MTQNASMSEWHFIAAVILFVVSAARSEIDAVNAALAGLPEQALHQQQTRGILRQFGIIGGEPGVVDIAGHQTEFHSGKTVAEPECCSHAAKLRTFALAQIGQRRLHPVDREYVELAGRAILGLLPAAQRLEQAPVGITQLHPDRPVIAFRIALQAGRFAEMRGEFSLARLEISVGPIGKVDNR